MWGAAVPVDRGQLPGLNVLAHNQHPHIAARYLHAASDELVGR